MGFINVLGKITLIGNVFWSKAEVLISQNFNYFFEVATDLPSPQEVENTKSAEQQQKRNFFSHFWRRLPSKDSGKDEEERRRNGGKFGGTPIIHKVEKNIFEKYLKNYLALSFRLMVIKYLYVYFTNNCRVFPSLITMGRGGSPAAKAKEV